jgi:hypothetical protein
MLPAWTLYIDDDRLIKAEHFVELELARAKWVPREMPPQCRSSAIRGLYNRATSGRRTKQKQSHSNPQIKKQIKLSWHGA